MEFLFIYCDGARAMKTVWMGTKLTSDMFSGACADAALVHIFAKCVGVRGETWLLPLGWW